MSDDDLPPRTSRTLDAVVADVGKHDFPGLGILILAFNTEGGFGFSSNRPFEEVVLNLKYALAWVEGRYHAGNRSIH